MEPFNPKEYVVILAQCNDQKLIFLDFEDPRSEATLNNESLTWIDNKNYLKKENFFWSTQKQKFSKNELMECMRYLMNKSSQRNDIEIVVIFICVFLIEKLVFFFFWVFKNDFV